MFDVLMSKVEGKHCRAGSRPENLLATKHVETFAIQGSQDILQDPNVYSEYEIHEFFFQIFRNCIPHFTMS
jgi:hypothetical protein